MLLGLLNRLFLCFLLTSAVLLASLPHVKAQQITVDGDPSDWIGTPPGEDNKATYSAGEFIWRDELNDDVGDGDYSYPTSLEAGMADLVEFRVRIDENYIYFLVKLRTLSNVFDSDAGFSGPLVVIGIDAEPGSGQEWVAQEADLKCSSEHLPEYQIVVARQQVVLDENWDVLASSSDGTVLCRGSTEHNAIELAVPLSTVGDPYGGSWYMFVVVGLEDETKWNYFREVDAQASASYGGGGVGSGGSDATPDWAEPDVYDCAFYSSKVSQMAELSAYAYSASTVDPAVLGTRGGFYEVIFDDTHVSRGGGRGMVDTTTIILVLGIAMGLAAVLFASSYLVDRLGRRREAKKAEEEEVEELDLAAVVPLEEKVFCPTCEKYVKPKLGELERLPEGLVKVPYFCSECGSELSVKLVKLPSAKKGVAEKIKKALSGIARGLRR